MSDVHIVWDWNGTLLDDLDLVVKSVSTSITRLGQPPITADDYRDHYTRPVRNFYESLFGRPVGDMEWSELNKTFHEIYHAGVDNVSLNAGAVESLRRVRALGWGQSLLSMSTEAHLVPTVTAHGIADQFDLVTGMVEASGDLKARHLVAHLTAQGVDPSRVVVIGDTPDDFHAAEQVGARTVLYNGGSHHRHVLEALGPPVVDSLPEALLQVEESAAV